MTRRKALKTLGMAAGITALETAGIYSYVAGLDGLKEDARYFYAQRDKTNYLIADSHAHPARPRNANELESLVQHLLRKKVAFQSVSAILKSNRTWLYEDLAGDIASFCSSNKEYSIQMSDEHATIISYRGKKTVFIRSQELSCLSPRQKEVHLCIEGMPYFEDFYNKPEDVIYKAMEKNATVILNHPYSIPNKILAYWIANREHEQYLYGLMGWENLLVETFNSMNALHMAASNGKAEAMARKYKRTMVASTDCHFSEMNLTLKQLGNAGFYVKAMPDLSSMTGKEIIGLKRELAINSPGLFRNYCPLGVFFDVMVKSRFSK